MCNKFFGWWYRDTRKIAQVANMKKNIRFGAIYDSRDYNKHFLSMDLYTRCSIIPPFSALGLDDAVFLVLRGRCSFVIRESLIGDHPSV